MFLIHYFVIHYFHLLHKTRQDKILPEHSNIWKYPASSSITCFQSVQYFVMYVRLCVNMCLQMSVQLLHFIFLTSHFFFFFFRLFTSGAEYSAVGGSKWKVREGELGVRTIRIESHFSKFDPISVILKPPVFKGPSTLLYSLWQTEKPERWGL